MPLYLFHTMVQKRSNDQKLKSRKVLRWCSTHLQFSGLSPIVCFSSVMDKMKEEILEEKIRMIIVHRHSSQTEKAFPLFFLRERRF